MELHENETFFFDLGRTLWNWKEFRPGASDLLESLKSTGRNVYFHTDNTLLSRKGYADKLTEMGFKTTEDQVITSGYVTGQELSKRGVTEVYVAGESGLVSEIEEAGIDITEDADYAVLGFDRSFSYNKLEKINDIVNDGGKILICSSEKFFQHGDEVRLHQKPFNSAVQEFTEPELTGKPSEVYRRHFKNYFSFFPGKSAFIGDRTADMVTGNSLGMTTAAVMNGAIDEEELRQSEDKEIPDYALTSLHKLRRRII
ncbi:MAG: HAD-IIA family hydrolase [Candidatus Nanosalina sp.]